MMKIYACALIVFAFQPCLAGQNAPVVKTVYSFTGKGKDVPVRHSRLIQGKDGNFYGTSNVQGSGDFGTIFKITPAGVRTTLHRFMGNGVDGAQPCDGLAEDRHGNFYGTTIYGGSMGGQGTVFRITPAGKFTVLHRFEGSGFPGGSTDGAHPHAGLARGKDGNLHGTTWDGGEDHDGTVFRITPVGRFTILHSFTDKGAEGILPYAGLVQASDGNLYGTTSYGGIGGAGTLYRITPAGVLTVLHAFKDGDARGAYLYDGVIQGGDGNFYGETSSGGRRGAGTVFQITPAGALTTLRSFSSYGPGGSALIDDLAPGSDGNIYGTTLSGGRWGNGAIFRISSKD